MKKGVLGWLLIMILACLRVMPLPVSAEEFPDKCTGVYVGKEVSIDGEPVSLTKTEYDILKLLMQNPGKVYSPRDIYAKVWGGDPYGAENTVAVHIRRLREKIEIDPARPRYLKVIWGRGYKIDTSLG